MKKKFLLMLFIFQLFVINHQAQVTQLNSNKGLEFVHLFNPNLLMLYSREDGAMWVSDGTPNGTKPFTNKVKFNGGGAFFNGKYVFEGYTTNNGYELWATDGTDAGTFLVKDIVPGQASSNPGDRFTVINQQLFFTASTPANGIELWKTDGTTNGTLMVKDILPGAGSSNAKGLHKLNKAGNLLYFSAETNAGEEVWVSDGTDIGTKMVKDVFPGSSSSRPVFLGSFQNKIVFNAEDGVHGSEPWISDGTTAGTFLLKDIWPGSMNSIASQIKEWNGKMIFTASNSGTGEELWISDGTTAGTSLLKDINPGQLGSNPTLINSIIGANGYLYFTAFTETNGLEIWRTNGTSSGTELFLDLEPGPQDAMPFLFPPFINGFGAANAPLFKGNQFFFSAFTNTAGFELYVTDGTVANTRLVKDIRPGFQDGMGVGGNWFYTNNAFYFRGNNGINGEELWKTDGTSANTLMVADINMAQGADSDVSPMVIVNNRLLLNANNGDNAGFPLEDLYAVDQPEQVLPVRLLSFKGSVQANSNLIDWTVSSTQDLSFFEIERSINGISFSAIGSKAFVAGSNQYSFNDMALLSEANDHYYRLKLILSNNRYIYSPVLKLSRKNNNPVQKIKLIHTGGNNLLINYSINKEGAELMVRDVSGKTLQRTVLNNKAGVLNISVPASTQIVFVSVYTKEGILTERMIL